MHSSKLFCWFATNSCCRTWLSSALAVSWISSRQSAPGLCMPERRMPNPENSTVSGEKQLTSEKDATLRRILYVAEGVQEGIPSTGPSLHFCVFVRESPLFQLVKLFEF